MFIYASKIKKIRMAISDFRIYDDTAHPPLESDLTYVPFIKVSKVVEGN